jgi:hypothetical protein
LPAPTVFGRNSPFHYSGNNGSPTWCRSRYQSFRHCPTGESGQGFE